LPIYTADDFRIILKEMEVTDYGTSTLTLLLENTSKHEVMVTGENICFNDSLTNGFLWSTLRSQTYSIETLYISDLEELDITAPDQVEKVSIDLLVEYMDGWDILSSTTETIIIDPTQLSA